MKRVVTAAQMADMDKYTIEQIRIPGIVLMENAGLAVFRYISEQYGPLHGKNITVLCGPGNNGGDGFVIARHLYNNGVNTNVCVLVPREKIKGDALLNLEILEQTGCETRYLESIEQVNIKPDVIIDAMLGTGVKGPLRGLFAGFAEWTQQQNCPVVAVDIPSGVNADTGAIDGPAVHADATITFALPKRGLLFSPGREHAGELTVADISIPEKTLKALESGVLQTEMSDVRQMLPLRSPDAYKNNNGMTAVIAGSRGFTGAACLTSMAAMRSGAGLCYLASPLSINSVYESAMAEVITWPLDDSDKGLLSVEHAKHLVKKLDKMTVLAMGPGLGTAPQTGELVFELLNKSQLPLVLDADGLNLCAEKQYVLSDYQAEMVITPHPGEFSRLTGLSMPEIGKDRIGLVKKYSQLWNAVIVLKGAPTLIGTPDGLVYINSTGNEGMATAGSGDVLTGIIAGFMSQGLSAEKAAITAVFVHGLAGDIAKNELGVPGVTATEILARVAPAIKEIKDLYEFY